MIILIELKHLKSKTIKTSNFLNTNSCKQGYTAI
jgi:hypothetical protein